MSDPKLTRHRKEEIEERVAANASDIEEKLSHIPNGRKIPDLDDLNFHEAKKFDLGIVFIDINNFKAYLSSNSKKDTLFMLNLFITQVMDLVRDYDGYFEKNTGDGALVYFGEESSRQEIVENILEFLATLKLVLANYINPTLEDHNIKPISISAGAAYSLNVHITKIGLPRHTSRRTLVSNAANAAFVLEEKAGINEFFVNEGIKRFSDPNGFGEAIDPIGFFDEFKWRSKKGTVEHAKYYKFTGKWSSTMEENLNG